MNIRLSVLLPIVVIVGLGIGAGTGYLQSRTGGNETARATNTSVQQSQGTTSSAPTDQQDRTQTNRMQGAFGTVEEVSTNGFTLVSQGGKLPVVTSSSTKVSKMAEVKVTDLKVSDSVIGTGSRKEDGNLAAVSIQVVVTDSLRIMGDIPVDRAGQFGQGGQRGQNPGTGSNTQQQRTPSAGMQSALATMVSGTIEAIEGNIITVKTQSGSSNKMIISDETVVRKMAEGSSTDITVGQTAMVSGERNSTGAIVATTVQLTPASLMPTGR